MRIQHNIMAMNAYRNYNNNTSALSKNLEKLSSGYKINRAGDDAAGLAISEKMRAQITGLAETSTGYLVAYSIAALGAAPLPWPSARRCVPRSPAWTPPRRT